MDYVDWFFEKKNNLKRKFYLVEYRRLVGLLTNLCQFCELQLAWDSRNLFDPSTGVCRDLINNDVILVYVLVVLETIKKMKKSIIGSFIESPRNSFISTPILIPF